jgi:hypothetical protein
VLRFIDLGGDERYLKTALYGMTAMLPDYGLLCVSARGQPSLALPRAAREHAAVALALRIPLAAVLTQARAPCRFSCGPSRMHALQLSVPASRGLAVWCMMCLSAAREL